MTGMIDDDAGLITETDGTKHAANGRKKRSRERGKDSKPRNFPLHTMKNLPQFRDKSHEEVRRYILEKKGVDIGSNFNWNGFAIAVLILVGVLVGGYGLWKWYDGKKSQKNHED
ncbi:hypothetical protein K0U27_10060 [archaeon]|nr:hypothetical protein [archaeon]